MRLNRDYLVNIKGPWSNAWTVIEGELFVYGAFAARKRERLDILVIPETQGGKKIYGDENCDGQVDVVRTGDAKGHSVDQQVPRAKPITLVSLAPVLDQAIKKGHIPYKVEFCE